MAIIAEELPPAMAPVIVAQPCQKVSDILVLTGFDRLSKRLG
jgi:hypothetical protein